MAHLPDLPLRDEHAAAVPLLSMHTIASVNVIGHSSLSLDDCKATGDDRGVTEKVKSRKRLSKAEQRAETMEQILDAAEDLFSKHGLHGVALKDVAKRVGVHHTLLNYYFTDKKALFDAVFARRAAVTSQRRIKALDDYETASAGKPTIEGALHTFLDTDLDLYIKGGEGWRNYGQLSAQVANTPKWGASLMDEHFDPVVLKLIGLLQKALPNCAPEDIFWGYHFVSGALMLTLARTGRIDKLSDGLCKSDDYAAVKERMASFMAAGFRAICEQRGREREEGSQARTS